MENIHKSDFIVEIFQDFGEIESMAKVLKDSVLSENNECTITDIGNVLEILLAKISNTKKSLDMFINDN